MPRPSRLARPPVMLDGLFAGTRVSTPQGWRTVEHLEAGDLVDTPHGPEEVVGVERGVFGRLGKRPALWPLHVPMGALGNRETVALTPRQGVLIPLGDEPGSPVATDRSYECRHARIAAAQLQPWRGIARFRPPEGAAVLRPVLARTGVICVGFGLFVILHGAETRRTGPPWPLCLSPDGAEDLMVRMMARDLGPKLFGP